MRPGSAKLQTAIKNSNTKISRAVVYSGNNVIQELEILDGNVQIDDVAIRYSADLTLTDPNRELVPADAQDLLSPYSGHEIRLYRGVRFDDGTEELIGLGVLVLDDVHIDDSGGGLHMRCDLYGRELKVQNAKFRDDWVVANGTPLETAIMDMIEDGVPGQTYTGLFDTTTGYTLPRTFFGTGDDRWQKIQSMSTDFGLEVFFNGDGECDLRALRTTAVGTPDWVYAEGELSMLLYINKRINTEGSYNGVIVSGENTGGAPVRGEAWDDDLESPTYSGYISSGVFGTSRFGQRPYFHTSQYVQTNGEAVNTALTLLNKRLGQTELVWFQGLVNPLHEIGDTVAIQRLEVAVDAYYVVDKLTIPMVHDRPMALSSRKRRFA